MTPASTTGQERNASHKSPMLFIVILGLIIFFLAAFVFLRGNGAGSTPNSPSTTHPASAKAP